MAAKETKDTKDTKDAGKAKGKDADPGRYDFVGKMKMGFSLSGLAVGLALVCLMVVGLNYGIDFKGGSIFHYRFEAKVTEKQIRDLLANSPLKKQLGEVVVQRVLGEVDLGLDVTGEGESGKATVKVPEGSEFIIHTEASQEVTESDDVEPKLQALFVQLGKFEKRRREFIGPLCR